MDKDDKYPEGTGKLMQSIFKFWTKTKSIVKSRSEFKILEPSISLTTELRDECIPRLIRISSKENYLNANTLVDLI